MIELDDVRVAEDDVVAIGRRGKYLRLSLRIPWQEMPHFVLLPDRFPVRWEHLEDEGLPVHLRSWSCPPCGSAPGLMMLNLYLRLDLAPPRQAG